MGARAHDLKLVICVHSADAVKVKEEVRSFEALTDRSGASQKPARGRGVLIEVPRSSCAELVPVEDLCDFHVSFQQTCAGGSERRGTCMPWESAHSFMTQALTEKHKILVVFRVMLSPKW